VSTSSLPRIAILGGGVGSVTAAIQLSQPDWRNEFSSITLYQQGWRLGGKGASGRGEHLRIEEHGLHIWFGFYENAFGMLRRCHDELDAIAAGAGGHPPQPRWPLVAGSVDESFRRSTEISLTDHDGCNWSLWTADFFADDDDNPWAYPDPRPPGARPDDWSVAFYAARCLQLAADLALALGRPAQAAQITADPLTAAVHQGVGGLEDATRALLAVLGGNVSLILNSAAHTLDTLAVEGATQPLLLGTLDVVVRALETVLQFLRNRYDQLVRASNSVRRAWYVVDLMVAIVRGVIEDGVIGENSFAVIDDVELREWLMSHGAARESVECALVRAVVYDLAFAYRGGDPQRPAAGAGTALRGLLRTFFTYRGALMYKMNAGMGDVVFAPLYELLVKRGVEIEFFHRVEAVRAAGGLIDEIEIDVQANVPASVTPRSYLTPDIALSALPAAHPSGLPAVWPSDPTPMLAGGTTTAVPVPPAVYESYYADRAASRVATKVLRRGQADGFELVVFGLPIGCVPYVAPDLPAQSPAWKAAVDRIETVATQALQLWLDKPGAELAGTAPGIVVGGYTEPFDTWADMPHLVRQEAVGGAETVAYFCNVLADSPAPPRGMADQWLRDQDHLVRAQALRFLTADIGSLWPKAIDPLTGQFDWARLIAPATTVGPARLDAQFRRANIEPSERYVLSVPGSSAYRIQPDDTGFGNLFATGDWTSCTLDAGCVEAAVIAGMVAANGIHRTHGDATKVVPIVGRHGP
jgi:uncharacterized protein with NAD-binding domain and iron-sulfur cluster